jgi:hypothetical protein
MLQLPAGRLAKRRQPACVTIGCVAVAPVAVQEAPTFFPTIEDFLWFKLCLVRGEGRGNGASVSFVGGGSGGGEAAFGNSKHIAPSCS